MSAYYIAVFDDVQALIDPDTIGVNRKRSGLPVWAPLIAWGALAGWGQPRIVSDSEEAWERVRRYEDRTAMAVQWATAAGLYVPEGDG